MIPPRIQRALDKLKKQASSIAKSPKKMDTLLQQANAKASRNHNKLDRVWDDLLTCFRLLKAWAKRDYKDVHWQSILVVLVAVLYFVNPLDLIPDFLLGGLVDDVTLLAAVVASLKTEIEAFRQWERSRP